jgi:hypothetical protein
MQPPRHEAAAVWPADAGAGICWHIDLACLYFIDFIILKSIENTANDKTGIGIIFSNILDVIKMGTQLIWQLMHSYEQMTWNLENDII